LEPRLRPHADRLRLEHVLGRAAREIAGELAERPLGLAHAGQDLALDDDLRRRGHGEIDPRARRDLERLAEEPADHLELADAGGGRRASAAPVSTRSWNAARATTLGWIGSWMRPAYSSASRDSGTPSAHASARRLATTLATTGMSAPTIFSNTRIGQRRRRSYSSTTAMTS